MRPSSSRHIKVHGVQVHTLDEVSTKELQDVSTEGSVSLVLSSLVSRKCYSFLQNTICCISSVFSEMSLVVS